ncbi:hypothetical protein CR513_60153, partial [Mucuna pruriens]
MRYLHMVNNVHLEDNKARRKLPLITFTNQNFVGPNPKQNDPMVIMVEVVNFVVKKSSYTCRPFKQQQIRITEIQPHHEQLQKQKHPDNIRPIPHVGHRHLIQHPDWQTDTQHPGFHSLHAIVFRPPNHDHVGRLANGSTMLHRQPESRHQSIKEENR